MKALGQFLGALGWIAFQLVLASALAVAQAMLLSKIWGWFVVKEFAWAQPLTLKQCIAATLVVRFLIGRSGSIATTDDDDSVAGPLKRVYDVYIASMWASLADWLLALVVQLAAMLFWRILL